MHISITMCILLSLRIALCTRASKTDLTFQVHVTMILVSAHRTTILQYGLLRMHTALMQIVTLKFAHNI